MALSKTSATATLDGRKKPTRTAADEDNGRAATAPSGTKQDLVLSMLRRPDGVTVAAVMEATGWQSHSVRGFLAGVVRKKLGLPLTSELSDHGRVYRSVTPKAAKPRLKKGQAELRAPE